MDRRDVLNLHGSRLKARETLEVDLTEAKTDLHPRTIASRWTAKQKNRVSEVADHAANSIKKNSLLIAAATVGTLLFAARKPILKLANKLRHKRITEQDMK